MCAPYSKGQKNYFRDAEVIAEAMLRPTMKFVATKTVEQLDLQALHRVLVSQRTGVINQIRAFLLERGVAVRQGQRFWRAELPRILAAPPHLRSLDTRIEGLSGAIEELAKQDAGCERLMSIPGIGPIISRAMVAGARGSRSRALLCYAPLTQRITRPIADISLRRTAWRPISSPGMRRGVWRGFPSYRSCWAERPLNLPSTTSPAARTLRCGTTASVTRT